MDAALATLPSLTMSYAHAACAGRRAPTILRALRSWDSASLNALEARRDVADCEVFGCSIDEMREIHERLVAARSDSVPDGYGVVAEPRSSFSVAARCGRGGAGALRGREDA